MHVHILTGSPCRHPMPAVACPLCRGALDLMETALVSADAVLATLRQARDLGATAVTLRDGDLLARPEALDLLAEARQLGFQAIEVWTSGPLLAQSGIAEAVVKAGAGWIAAPLYGDSALSQDYVTGQPGHFQRTLAGLQKVRAAGGRPVVLAPILRPTYRNLPQLVQKSLPIAVQAFRFLAPLGQDRPDHPLTAPLPMAAQALRAALQIAATAKRRATVLDVPACLLEADAKCLDRSRTLQAMALDVRAPTVHEQGKPCEPCAWKTQCPGLARDLATQHGWLGIATRT